jgi:predicted permease
MGGLVVSFFGGLWRDVVVGIRNLQKNPAFAALAAGSLALGIGATTAMYSVIFAVLLDPFSYKDVATLVSPVVREPGRRGYRSYCTIDQFLEIEKRSRIFDGLTFSTIDDVVWTGSGEPQRLRGNHTTMNGFAVMGVPPLLGRVTSPADAQPLAEPVAILGYRFWQKQFGGDPSVIGQQMTLNGTVRTVIGVMPRRFMWRGADVYLPTVPHPGQPIEGVHFVHVVGRLKPGVTDQQAEADLRPIIQELQRESPKDFPEKWRTGVLGFAKQFESGLRDALLILFGAVGLLLLISCVNVSNLLLSKATGRSKEIAVRTSLGATRWRIVRQLLCESLALALVGGVLGIAIARFGLAGIMAMTPPDTIPDEALVQLNVPALLFAVAISIGSAVLFGLAPAIQISGADLYTPLKEAGRGSTGTKRQILLRSALVVGEIALSLMLLVGASLMIRTLFAVQNVDLGMQPSRILTLRVPLTEKRYPSAAQRNAFMTELVRRTEALPGVAAVGVASGLHPLWDWNAPVVVAGNASQDGRRVLIHNTNGGYTKAMGISLVQGRMFDEQDAAHQAHVAVVNQAFVKRYSPAQNPIGRLISVPEIQQELKLQDASFQVVGIVRDVLNDIFEGKQVMPEIYVPYTVTEADHLVVRSYGDPEAMSNAVRAQVYAIDKDQPGTEVKTEQRLLQDFVYARPRFNLFLFSIFAALGLILALLGVYGVVSSAISQRTQEIGIRMALGATFREVVVMVLTSGAKLVGAGVVLGLIGSLLSVRVLAQQVWNLSTFDPYTFAAASLLVIVAGLLACFWPARSAARIDPILALRHE